MSDWQITLVFYTDLGLSPESRMKIVSLLPQKAAIVARVKEVFHRPNKPRESKRVWQAAPVI